MSLPVDTLKLIQEMAIGDAGVRIHEIPGDPDHLLIECNGGYEERRVPPAHRRHKVWSLDDFVAAAKRWGGQGTVWHSDRAIVLVIDDDDRRDGVVFELECSQPFTRLVHLEKEPRLNQAGLIRLLRHDLVGAVPGDLVTAFRRLDFRRRSDGTADIRHGRESLGRSVENEVAGMAELPEAITAEVRVYRSVGIPWTKRIRMTLDIDAANEAFVLTPEPDALTDAIHSIQEDIANALGAELVDDPPRIFYGEP